MTVTNSVTGFKKWALILAVCFILQRSPLRAHVASAPGAAAFGSATASGTASLAAGDCSTASGFASAAFGAFNTASAYGSISTGLYCTASGYYAVAFGVGSFAPGGACAAFGWNSTASGYASTAFGSESKAIGFNCTASGSYTMATGNDTTASGFYTVASAPYSFAIGAYNIGGGGPSASGADPVFEIGNGTSIARSDALVVYRNGNTTISGTDNELPNQTLIGSHSILTEGLADGRYLRPGGGATGADSTAFGTETTASGYASTASGFHTSATAVDAFVTGAYNIGGGGPTVSGTDPIFEIGNGTSSVPSDAVVVHRNGNMTVSGTATFDGGIIVSGSSNAVLVNPAGDLSMGSFTSGPQPH